MPRPPSLPDRLAARASTGPRGLFSPLARAALDGLLGRLLDLAFRPTLSGLEHIPAEGPCLIVSNHSGGGGIEILCLALMWHRRFGASRPITGMAHPVAFFLPGPRGVVRALGAIPSTYTDGLKALRDGLPVLIFPGGDHDAFRPIWHARRVDFNRRKGFLRLARQAHVPIIPLGIHGSHYTVPILWTSRVLPWLTLFPRLLGSKRVPVTLLGVVGALLLPLLLNAWLGWPVAALIGLSWLVNPIAMFFPIVPWPIRARLGAPIPPEDLFGGLPDDDPLDDAYDRVICDIHVLVNAPDP